MDEHRRAMLAIATSLYDLLQHLTDLGPAARIVQRAYRSHTGRSLLALSRHEVRARREALWYFEVYGACPCSVYSRQELKAIDGLFLKAHSHRHAHLCRDSTTMTKTTTIGCRPQLRLRIVRKFSFPSLSHPSPSLSLLCFQDVF